MSPDLQPDVPLLEVALFAILNPATILISMWMGRKADARAKTLIAAFAGAIGAIVLLYLAALVHIFDAATIGRAAVGVFIVALLAGLIWAQLGYALRRR